MKKTNNEKAFVLRIVLVLLVFSTGCGTETTKKNTTIKEASSDEDLSLIDTRLYETNCSGQNRIVKFDIDEYGTGYRSILAGRCKLQANVSDGVITSCRLISAYASCPWSPKGMFYAGLKKPNKIGKTVSCPNKITDTGC